MTRRFVSLGTKQPPATDCVALYINSSLAQRTRMGGINRTGWGYTICTVKGSTGAHTHTHRKKKKKNTDRKTCTQSIWKSFCSYRLSSRVHASKVLQRKSKKLRLWLLFLRTYPLLYASPACVKRLFAFPEMEERRWHPDGSTRTHMRSMLWCVHVPPTPFLPLLLLCEPFSSWRPLERASSSACGFADSERPLTRAGQTLPPLPP